MDEIMKLTDELHQSLMELSEIKEFLKLKDLYENNQELAEMRLNIARLTKDGKEAEKKNLLDIYNSHPLVVNYNAAKEEAYLILETIKNIIDE